MHRGGIGKPWTPGFGREAGMGEPWRKPSDDEVF